MRKGKGLYRILNMDHKKMAVILGVLFLCSLIPILTLSGYVHATGDDYGYGSRTHQIWLETHSLLKTFKAAAQTSRSYWYGWQGTWFTIFLMSLQPEVFSPNAYWIVPWIMLLISFSGTMLILHYFLAERLQLPRSSILCADILLLSAMIQFFPSTRSGIFWYNGSAHYIIPYGLAMLAIYSCLEFSDHKKIRWLVIASLCMSALGGSSYLAALLALIALVYILLGYVWKRRYVLWLLLPLCLELTGLYISAIAPGNKVRGGEDFGFHFGQVISTIGECFVQGLIYIREYIARSPAALILLVLATFIVYEGFRQQERMCFSFRMPLLCVILMYATWCAMFAPGLYAGVELSGGVPNTIWQIFILTSFASMVYCAGWLAVKMGRKRKYELGKTRLQVMCPIIVLMAVWLFLNKGTIKESTCYESYEFLATGQAADYKAQMEERLAILLNPALEEVELPAMNSEQGPLMHMEVLEDPDGWTNSVVAQFYGKKRVVEVPRHTE